MLNKSIDQNDVKKATGWRTKPLEEASRRRSDVLCVGRRIHYDLVSTFCANEPLSLEQLPFGADEQGAIAPKPGREGAAETTTNEHY
jgi:hypothetical protein